MAAAGSVYYVTASGFDRNPGDARRPVRTIGRAAMLAQPGDMVVVSPGTYQEAVVLTQSGESGAPIVFRGLPGAVLVSPDPTASLSAFDISSGVSHVTLQGFELRDGFGETVFVRPGAHDVELAGLHIHHNHTGIWIAGAANVTVRDCLIDHNRRTGVRIYAGAHHIQILDTRSEANDDGSGCQGDSDGFNADASTSDVYFERASALGNSEDGFDLKGPNMTLLQVTAQDNGCSGVKIWAGGYLENVLVERSRIGIKVNAPPGATTALENCTLSQNDLGVRASGSDHTLVVRNSIIVGPAKALSYPASVQLREGHNIFYRPLSKDRLIVRQDANGETLYSGDDVNRGKWRRESGQGDATVARDPRLQFGSCRLSSNSAAIDSGEGAGSPLMDLAGTPRPVGAAVDRGAFEWIAIAPILHVRRALVRTDGTGSGSLRLRAEVRLAPEAVLDPLTDPVKIAVRGARGDVVRIEVPPNVWKQARRRDRTVLRVAQGDDATRSARLSLQTYPDRVALRLSMRGAALWTVNDNAATVTVELGHVRASTDVTLRTVGATPRLPEPVLSDGPV